MFLDGWDTFLLLLEVEVEESEVSCCWDLRSSIFCRNRGKGAKSMEDRRDSAAFRLLAPPLLDSDWLEDGRLDSD